MSKHDFRLGLDFHPKAPSVREQLRTQGVVLFDNEILFIPFQQIFDAIMVLKQSHMYDNSMYLAEIMGIFVGNINSYFLDYIPDHVKERKTVEAQMERLRFERIINEYPYKNKDVK